MKNLVICLMMLSALLISCSKESNKIRSGEYLSIRAMQTTKSSALKSTEYLSSKEIVKQTFEISFINKNVSTLPTGVLSRGFGKEMRDTIENRLKMYSTDVIREDGSLKLDFIEGRDFILNRVTWVDPGPKYRPIFDTIAYIPNSVVKAAEAKIKEAYSRGDYNTCYEVMDKDFRFAPITGAEWRELKRQGIE